MLLILVLMSFLSSSRGQRAPTWEACQCSWNAWQAWSDCDKLCYGSQRRSRSVQVLDTPSCGTFESCDYGNGGWDYQQCNTHCTYGNYDSGYGGCKCPAGRYGVCCTNAITCGSPSDTANGDVSVTNGYDYDSVATYTCHAGYNMTGTATMTCTAYTWSQVGYWSETPPRCLYVQPPVMSDCEDNTTLNTADHELTHQWTVPTFSDPHGNDVTTTSNYGSNSYRFPWGDFFVQYVATQPSNGLQTECKFQLQVRPFPCPEFPIPVNGYVACNDWRSDYGQFCLIGCRVNYSLPRDIDERQWFVCGSSGSWTPSISTIQCGETLPGSLSSSGGLLGSPTDCSDDFRLDEIKEQFITELKSSSFNSFCLKSPDQCIRDRVGVECA